MTLLCPKCHETIPLSGETPPKDLLCLSCGAEYLQASNETVTILRDGNDETVTYISVGQSEVDLQRKGKAGKTFGDYELIEEIARGGMGVVYKARQVSLNRIVALKMIRSGELAGDDEIQRFQTEAEAAARLDHPNIVPIYEVGERNGLHYFSMGFVEGTGLDDRLKHGPLPPRDAAALIRRIALAIGYAHEKGIVHRDLKPANVLIDADGNPRITDFGLAKNIAADSGMTATGQVIGTPSYMPPEQASGKTEEIGPLADVYSLGAMLYALLTGRPPFQAANVIETLKQVVEREPVSPRTLNPAIDRDLETICLKCLEKSPENRYAAAVEIADELQAYFDGKPILARPIGPAQRTMRWCRRNPLATLAIALGLVLAIGGPYMALQQNLLREQAEQNATAYMKQRDKAIQEGERANKNLVHAVDVVDAFLTKVSDDGGVLSRYPNTQRIRRELLEKARDYYITFLRENSSAPLTPQLSAAQFRLGNIHAMLGENDRSLAAFRAAVKIDRQLVGQNPDDAALQNSLASTLHNMGITLQALARPTEAMDAYEEGLEIRQRLSRNQPGPRYQAGVARLQNAIGTVHSSTGAVAKSLIAYEAARDIWIKLVDADPANPLFRSELARSYFNIALQKERQNATAEAFRDYRQARLLRERLAKEFPTEAAYQDDLAATLHNISLTLDRLGQLKESAAALQQALEIRDRLSRDNPDVPKYGNGLAKLHHSLGLLHQKLGNNSGALTAFERAVSIRGSLKATKTASPDQLQSLAKSLSMQGSLLAKLGKRREAEASLDEALKICRRLAKDAPDIFIHSYGLAKAHAAIGDFQLESGNLEMANASFGEALDIAKRLRERDPSNRDLQDFTAIVHRSKGIVLRRLHRFDAASAELQLALKMKSDLLEDNPGVAEHYVGLAIVHESLGHLHRDAGRLDDAEQEYERGLQLYVRLAKRWSVLVEHRVSIALLRSAIAGIHARRGRHEAAIDQQKAVLAIWSELANQHPTVVRYRDELAGTYGNLAIRHRYAGNLRLAKQHYDSAIAIQQKLLNDRPESPEFQQSLAKSLNNLGDLQRAMRKTSDALTTFRKAEAIQRRLTISTDARPEYRDDLVLTLYNIGLVLSDRGKHADAVAIIEEGIAISKKLSQQFPHVARYRSRWAAGHHGLGSVHINQKDSRRALIALDQSIAIRESQSKAFPQQASIRDDLAASLNNAGRLYGRAGKSETARKYYERALTLRKELLKQSPDSLRYQLGVAWTELNLAILLRDLDAPASLDYSNRAVPILTALWKRQPTDGLLRNLLRDAHWVRGTVFNVQKKFLAAETEWRGASILEHPRFHASDTLHLAYALAKNAKIDDAVKVADGLSKRLQLGAYQYRCAAVYAVCATKITNAADGSTSDANTLSRSSIRWLRSAADAGYFNAADNQERLRTDPDFRLLRAMPEFQMLFRGLSPQAPVSARKP